MAEVLDLTLSSDDEAAKHQDKKPKIAPATNESDDEVECLDENPFAPPPPLAQAAADSGDDEDVAITGSKGQNALQHFPHCRENCVVHLFATDPTQHCSQCFCVVCDVPASRCAAWPQHCRLKYADPSTQRLRRDARAAALLQQAGGAPTAKQLGSQHTAELYQPDAATSMTALLRAVTQVWPVEAPAPPGLAPGTALRPYQRQSLAFMLDLENARSDDRRLGYKTLWKEPNGVTLFRLRAGWLCDEVGMGKTLSIISLILARPRPANQLPTDAQWRTLQRRHPFISRVRGPDKTIRKYFAKEPGLFGKEKEIPAHEYYMGSDWGAKNVSDDGTRYSYRNVPNPDYATWTKAPALPGGAQTLTIKATVISCPVTLIGQWHDEITKWAPGLRVLVNHSSHDDRKELEKGRLNDSLRDYDVEPVWNQIRAPHAIDVTCFGAGRSNLSHWLISTQVIICSPNTRLGGRSILQHPELRFHRLIVDEAHVTRGAPDRFLTESETVRHGTKNEHVPRFDSCWLVTGTPFTTGLSQLKLGAESIAWWGRLRPYDGGLNPQKFSKVSELLRSVMIRHTKDQQIHGARALALPKMDMRTVRLDLPQAARAGYEQIRATCAAQVRQRVGVLKQLHLEMDLGLVRRACADTLPAATPAGVSQDYRRRPTPFIPGVPTTAKLDALRDDLRKVRSQEPHAHCVVFTEHKQSHAMIVEMLKNEQAWTVVGLDGQTQVPKRHAAIRDFQKFEKTPKVLVVTLRAGAVGITLTAATRLYLFEPCLDPSHEIQAAGRVHRLGQLKDVHIVRFVYKQTIEDAICELHDKVRANQIQIIDGTYSTRALRLLLSK